MEEKLEVICDNLLENPQCPHGPTILFKRITNEGIEEYYACSAYRSKKICKFYLKRSDYLENKCNSVVSHPVYFDVNYARKMRVKFLAEKPERRCYCHSCNMPFKLKNIDLHENHDILNEINDERFRNPTKILRPLSNDKAEAQYFFNSSTLKFLGSCLKSLGIRKVICMGAPRLHEYIRSKQMELQIESFLLDIDQRFYYFYSDNEFAWFNMFNSYFFEGNRETEVFKNFLKINRGEPILLFTDPPFGCRTEPLIQTIKEINTTYQRTNLFHEILPIFWIFPYFMEIYIKKFMSEMEMIDYKINYTNHELYNDGAKGRKQGSPVRLFTNIPPHLIELPKYEGYKFCEKCNRWTGIENVHCDKCNECPSKNGDTYRHCALCATCVKPNYVHCNDCGRCTQKENHTCEEYQKNVHCYICKKLGHTERKCKKWRRENDPNGLMRNTSGGCKVCLLCNQFGHNENNCPRRKPILKETFFMGNIENIFNSV